MESTTVPIISLAELRQGCCQDALRRCATEKGLFYLSHCGLSEYDHRCASDAAMAVFEHSSMEERQLLTPTLRTTRRGYSPLEAESTATVTNTGEYSDYSMCYSMGLSDNLFPSPRFEAIWQDYFRRLYKVAQETARFLLMSVDSSSGQDLDQLLDCDPVLRLRYFPEVPEHRVAECEPLRMAPHYDLSILTLIHQTPCANGFVSLRAQIGGETIDLPVRPDTMLVLCGAIATLVTHGAVPAPRHQVAAPPASLRCGSGRTSSVFFLRPSPSFAFSVSEARKYGLDVCLDTDNATFGEWIGSNYIAMQTAAVALP